MRVAIYLELQGLIRGKEEVKERRDEGNISETEQRKEKIQWTVLLVTARCQKQN